MIRFNNLFEETPQGNIIYLDMDGVLCDFLGRVKEVTGEDFGSPTLDTVGKKEIKYNVSQEPRFWHDMAWNANGQQLWRYVKKYNPQILSAYANWDKNSIPGKHEWVKKNLGIPKNRVNLVKRAEKENYANKNGTPNILIDDYIKNIREWESRGGIGIHHINTDRTIAQLKKLGL